MGFFKKLGNSLKSVTKMISLKNITKVATGNVAGLATEFAGRVATPFVAKATPSTAKAVASSPIVQAMETTAQAKSQDLSNMLVTQLASNTGVQNTASMATGFFTKVYWTAMWQKNKAIIIVGVLAVVGLIVWLFSRRGNNRQGARRRK